MSKNKSMKCRRDRLFAKHPYCHWCGCGLIQVTGPKVKHFPPNAATLDHRFGRLDPRRRSTRDPAHRSVLACLSCNELRGRLDMKAVGINELRLRSKNHLGKHIWDQAEGAL